MLLVHRETRTKMRKVQTGPGSTWRVYMFFPSKLYYELGKKAPKEGYTKRELEYDHHVKDYLISLLEEKTKESK